MKKKIVFDKEAREKLQKGADTLANAVKVTLGPSGRNVILGDIVGNSHITKDGVTVARQIFCDDYIENIGAQTVKNVSIRTADDAGDGTSSSVILSQEILRLGLDAVNDGCNPMDLKKGMDKAAKAIVSNLKEISTPVSSNDQIKQVAIISANNDEEVGGVTAEAMELVKNEGLITVSESDTLETYVKQTEGYEMRQGFITPYFINDKRRGQCVLENPLIAISDYDITNFRSIQNIVGNLFKSVGKDGMPKQDLLIICDKMEGEALGTLIQNLDNPMGIKICIVSAPYVGNNRLETLEDISILTGGLVFSEKKGRNIVDGELTQLGTCEKAVISHNKTILMNGGGDRSAIDERIKVLNEAYDNMEASKNKDILKERKNSLAMTQAVIHVGASSTLEMNEKKDRYDDAICATRSAWEEGVVPGGGTALIRCMNVLDDIKTANYDEKKGVDIIRDAILSPFQTILFNAGFIKSYDDKEFGKYLSTIKDSDNINYGFNAKTGKFEDLIKSGVIDPTKVTRNVVENATSISSLLITTECVVADLTMQER